jgi:uncharacterized protein YjbI with pentapeptide repeats
MRALVLLLLIGGGAWASDTRIHADEALQTLAREGRLRDATVEGDLNLNRLEAPGPGGTLSMESVVVLGSLRGAPDAPLEIVHSVLNGLRVNETLWRHPLVIERTTIMGPAILNSARFEKGLACRRCIVRSVLSLRRTSFGDEADFAFSELDGPVDFGGARFRAASFDGVRIGGEDPVLFNEADFGGPARFAGMQASRLSFLGVTFREDANFRGCRVARSVFAPGLPDSFFANAVAVFGGVADFRRCVFADGLDLPEVGLRAGARFDHVNLRAGVLDLRRLGPANGEVVLSGLVLGAGARVAIDQSSVPLLATDAEGFAAERWAGLAPDTLDALAARARALGFAVAARRLEFVAASARSDAGWSERANWALQWPTENLTNLGRPILLGICAWAFAALATLRRGSLVRIAPEGAAPGLFARVIEPLYRPIEDPSARHAVCPVSIRARATAAASYAFALIFKLGMREFRPAEGGWYVSILSVLWLAGFGIVALIVATMAQVLPGLRELVTAFPT